MKFTGTKNYVATDDLKIAVNAAIVLERPLLIKGEPGTGKTVLAEEVAKALGAPLLTWHIKSTTKAQQGLYEYDAVSRLRDSQLGDASVSDIANYIKRGKLWEAFTHEKRPVLLIDEIDKADIEFPNDLLLELDRMEFFVYETGENIKATLRPIVMITSNNEKELPDAFLRRCFFHYIKFPDVDTMKQIVDVHFPGIKKRLVEEAMRIFFEVREVPGLKKKPSTSELLDWLKLLLNEDMTPEMLQGARPAQADPAAARRAAEERAGRASVRAAGVFEPARSLGMGGPALAGTASAQNSPESAALDTSLRGAVERKDVPGVVALVTDRERVLYQSAFGVADVATGRPLTSDALFRIASMTKPVTSVALMQLVEQGRLGLDDPAEKYLPELVGLKVFESFDAATGAYKLRPASRPATVRHFLTHTSGLAYPFTSPTWRDFKPRAGETYPFGGPLLFDPGERWHYSTSTDVVGKLVEAVSGQKLEDYFRQHILAPLKMDDTSYNVPEAKGPRLVAQQWRAGERMDGAIELQKPQLGLTIAAPIGGGGLASTAEDYGRFVRMLLNGGALDGVRVLKAETVALMGQNHIGAVRSPRRRSRCRAAPTSPSSPMAATNGASAS